MSEAQMQCAQVAVQWAVQMGKSVAGLAVGEIRHCPCPKCGAKDSVEVIRPHERIYVKCSAFGCGFRMECQPGMAT